MNDWQPIETAPRLDALNEILVSDGKRVNLAFWDEEEGEWLDSANHSGGQHASLDPTHWMPLPEPPKP